MIPASMHLSVPLRSLRDEDPEAFDKLVKRFRLTEDAIHQLHVTFFEVDLNDDQGESTFYRPWTQDEIEERLGLAQRVPEGMTVHFETQKTPYHNRRVTIAILHPNKHTINVAGVGAAVKSPLDQDHPEVGKAIALTRAFAHLPKSLIKRTRKKKAENVS